MRLVVRLVAICSSCVSARDERLGERDCTTAAPGKGRPSPDSPWVLQAPCLYRSPGGQGPRGGGQGGRQPPSGRRAGCGEAVPAARSSLIPVYFPSMPSSLLSDTLRTRPD